METKPMEGPKQFYEYHGKYYKIISTRKVYSYICDESVYMFNTVKLCKLEHDKDMMIPVSDYSKELKKVSFYDLIPTGRSKTVKYLIYHSQLIDNFIVKDA
jgi:hypothetical protein